MAVRRGGRIEPEPQQPDHVRDRIAAHEAGHVAACVALRGPGWVYAVTIGPMSGDTSYGDERVAGNLRPDGELRDALVVAFAGAYAESTLLGEASSSSGVDIAIATRIALERTRTGLSEGLTPLDLDKLDTNVSEILKVELANDLIAQIGTARALAAVIVEKNVEPIRRFAAALAQARELTGPELRAAVDAAGFVPVERP
jgi:ATP-dependent Zn protease